MSEAPVRIMYIITRLSIGSPAMHVTLLAQKLRALPYETILVSGLPHPDAGDMRYFAEAHGIQPVYIPELGRGLNPVTNLLLIYRLYRLIRQYQPDIVHTHLPKAGFAGRWAAWLAGVPVIVHTFHTHAFQNHFHPAAVQVFVLAERLTARITDAIITLTQSLRHDLSEVYRIARKGRMTTLPLGLDLSPFAHTPRRQGIFRQQWGIPSEAPLVGIVGRLAPIKNHELFLEAAAQVWAALPESRFVIVGDGETRPEVERKIRALGLQDAVILTGWQRELGAVYSDLDLLVNSSISEGTPTPIMEALTAGCPVVATAVGGVPDMLDHGRLGLLVFSGDAESLAGAMLSALRDPLDTAATRAVMLNRYGVDRLVGDLDSLYRGLLAKKGRYHTGQ
jgi:glycosyltransferase involved in cell wall biosynthesis